MGTKSIVGMEVPYIGSDSVEWVEASVPNMPISVPVLPRVAPPTEDYASCVVIGTPSTYLIWRICKMLPHAMEVLELCADKEIPIVGIVGLRIIFPEPLSPFAYICKNEKNCADGIAYLLYALSVSGTAYVFQLKNISAYVASFVFSSDEVLHFDTKISSDCGPISTVTATAGCLVIGRYDGSVSCFRIGLVKDAPGFMYELKDEATFSRLWGLMSRSRIAGPVKDLVVSDVHGKKIIFVLHSGGTLRIWDLHCRRKLFSQSWSDQGTTSRLWVGPPNVDSSLIYLAIFHQEAMGSNMQWISICSLHFRTGERCSLALDSSMQYIPLSEGKVIDVKFSSKKIWILKEDALLEWDLQNAIVNVEERKCYSLQEAFIAEQLFLNSEHCLDDLYRAASSIFPSSEAQVVGFVSSIFLRRLLLPAVYNSIALRSTLEDYGKKWSDSEFQVLTVDGVRSEVLLLIEQEAVSGSPFLAFKCWREFCARYFDRWRKANVAFSLLVDVLGGAVGLIRQNAISLFRSLEDIELLMYGNFEALKDFSKFGFGASNDGFEHEILFEVLRCTRVLSQQLGPAISPVFYESVVGAPMMTPEDIVARLLKTVDCGFNISMASSRIWELGTDFVRQKELADHKSLRKFSVCTVVSLRKLCKKASGWSRVLNVIECYLNLLVPRKPTEKLDSDMTLNTNISLIVQATSQVAEVMFESALDVLLFLSYLLDISGQVYMLPDDMSKIQHEFIPMVHEIIAEWLIIYFLSTMPSESLCVEDFSSQLSSLRIDSNTGRMSWTEKLGSIDFTLAFVLLLDAQGSSAAWGSLSLNCLPQPVCFPNLIQHFSGWIIWGGSGEKPLNVFGRSTHLAQSLLRHGQYNAAENLLMVLDAHMRHEKLLGSLQSIDGDWCVLHHLLGCCLLARAQDKPHGSARQKKVNESIRSYFRASSGEGAAHVSRKLHCEAGLVHPSTSGCVSTATGKLQYYQWVMQKFEQHGMSDAAGQFALAALEQVDEAVRSDSHASEVFLTDESVTSIKGRLWANVFKFALDRGEFYDAYCAMVSNPDEESKYICLRRFIIVLYERGAAKILCNSHLPFVGLNHRVGQELAGKAARSDISTRPNPYKLLYAVEMHQQNWRMAARYIYLYSTLLKCEMSMRGYQNTSLALQERLDGISAAINCLHLVHPMYAWIDVQMGGSHLPNASHPSKKARTLEEKSGRIDSQAWGQESYIVIKKLEDEFVLTSAEYLLYLANVRWMNTGRENLPSDLVDLLVEKNLYDMALTVILRFWKDSGLKKELERVFSAMALKCIPSKSTSPMIGSPSLLLASSKSETMIEGPFDVDLQLKQPKSSEWEVLEQYLEKYKRFHSRLPVVVAETLLCSDPQIELPLWLANYFTDARKEHGGMSGQESDPATLFRLYVDYGRYPEATELLFEYIEAYALVRPAGIIQRKRAFATWFPYTAIERLWCHLEEAMPAGHMPELCEKRKVLLHGALRSHLILLKADSQDAISFPDRKLCP